MAIIPEHILDQVRQANDIVEVINGYFPLKRRGANFLALCPFHKEKTPSFNVHPGKQIYHCFGCGAGGDVFGFVMKYENLPFMDAVRRLAERGGVHLEVTQAPGTPTRDEKDALFKLHEAVTLFFHHNLLTEKSAEPGRAYLKKRQIPVEVIKRWRLGYAPDAWDGLIQWARGKGFKLGLLADAGLVVPREGSDGFYDRFRGRMMIPIADDQGRVVAFSGRILTDAKDQPKYVNSPETAIFQKGRILFALDRARQAIQDAQHVIVCEGQLDTIACHEAGFSNVVAPQGTAFTEQHARMLKRFTDEVVLMFDGDEAGQNAAVRNAEPLWELGVIVRVALLPGKHDPDSFLKEEGAEKLRALLGGAPSFFDFLLDRLSRQHDARTDRGKRQIAEEMVPWLCRLRDPIQQARFAEMTAKRLGVREEAVRQAMRNSQRHGYRQPDAATPEEAESIQRPAGPPSEQTLLQVMLADERITDIVAERLDHGWLSGSVAADLVVRVLDLHGRGAWNGAPSLLNTVDQASQRLLSELLLKPSPKGDGLLVAAECLATLERHGLEQEMQAVRKQLGAAGLTAEETSRLQLQALDLRKRMDNIARLLKDSTRETRH
jgi:DNA primase